MSAREAELALQTIQSKGSKAGFEELRTYLQLVRELKVRQSEDVAEYGLLYLRKFRKRLTQEEELLTSEQVAIAAMDCQAHDAAFLLVTALRKKFPTTSQRTSRLVEMYFESKGQLEKAQETYIEKALEAAPDSQYMLKRQVAMEKTKDNLPGAIDLLCKYVDLFMTDREAWEELAELYLQQQEQQVTCSSITATPHEMLTKQDGKRFWPLEKPSSLLHQPDAQGRARFPAAQMYSQAAHCYEELLLHQAHNIHYYVQYADVLYTVGGANGHNYRTARSYYAAAVQLSGGRNVRALYGLCACTTQLAGIKGTIGKDKEELGPLAAGLLQQIYNKQCPDKLPLLTDMLKAQGLPLQSSAVKSDVQ